MEGIRQRPYKSGNGLNVVVVREKKLKDGERGST